MSAYPYRGIDPTEIDNEMLPDLREDFEEEQLLCEYCGRQVDRLVTVEDNDEAALYHGSVELCETCSERGRRA